MTVGIYMRVSTDAQETRLQLRDLLGWLKANGLARHHVRWFRDRGEKSDAKSRPAWDRLMNSVRAGEIRTLVVWKVDRANRWGAKDHLRWRLELDAAGVELVSLTEPDAGKFESDIDLIRDTIEASGRAKWLRDHRDRTRSGVRAALAGGAKWGGARVTVNKRGTTEGCRKCTPEQVASAAVNIARGSSVEVEASKIGIAEVTMRRHLSRRRHAAQESRR